MSPLPVAWSLFLVKTGTGDVTAGPIEERREATDQGIDRRLLIGQVISWRAEVLITE
jgi:hypothetical protein